MSVVWGNNIYTRMSGTSHKDLCQRSIDLCQRIDLCQQSIDLCQRSIKEPHPKDSPLYNFISSSMFTALERCKYCDAYSHVIKV